MWNFLFRPVCYLYLQRDWLWLEWLFAELGGRAWYESEVAMGWWDKDGNPVPDSELEGKLGDTKNDKQGA